MTSMLASSGCVPFTDEELLLCSSRMLKLGFLYNKNSCFLYIIGSFHSVIYLLCVQKKMSLICCVTVAKDRIHKLCFLESNFPLHYSVCFSNFLTRQNWNHTLSFFPDKHRNRSDQQQMCCGVSFFCFFLFTSIRVSKNVCYDYIHIV